MAQRKLTPQELAEIDAAGYDVSSIVDQVVEVPDEQFSAGEAYGRNLATSALPAVGGGVGAGLGMKGGAILGAPFGPPGIAIGAVVGGLAGGFAGSKLTSVAQEEFIPEETKQRTALASQQHPTAAMLGGLSAMPLGGMMPTPSGVANALGGAGKLAAYGAGRLTRPLAAGVESTQPILNAMEKQALINSAVGAGLGPINEAVTAKMEGRDITAKDLALSSAIGAAFNSPTPVIGKAMGFHMPPTPQLQTEAGFRRAFAAPADGATPTMEPTELPLRLPVQEQINQAAGIVTANEKVPLLNADGTPKLDDKGKPLTVTQPKPSKKAQESAAAIAQAESEGRPVVSRIDESVITAANEAAAKKKAALAKKAIPSPDMLVDLVKEELAKTNPTAYSQRWNELLPHLKEVGLTDDALALMQKEVFGPKGLNLKVGGNLGKDPVTGQQRVGRWNPETPTDIEVGKGAGPAIPAHEGFHEQWSKMTNEERARWKAATADELAAVNAERMKENKPIYGEEEWFAMQGSVEFLSKGLNTRKEGAFQKWLGDTKAIMKQQFGKDVTAEDLLRAHNYRLMNESRGVKPMVSGGKGEEKSATADENLGAEYNQLQLALKDKSVPFQEKMAAWKRLEEIKNANKGMPPGKESGETVEINPNWREDQREDMQGLYGKDRYATTDENLGAPKRRGARTDQEKILEAKAAGTFDELQAKKTAGRFLTATLAKRVSPENAKLTIPQLAAKYGTEGKPLPESTLYRWINQGKLRSEPGEALGTAEQLIPESNKGIPVEETQSSARPSKAGRTHLGEVEEDVHAGGKLTKKGEEQFDAILNSTIQDALERAGFSKLPQHMDRKAIRALVKASLEATPEEVLAREEELAKSTVPNDKREELGLEPLGVDKFGAEEVQKRNLPKTLIGSPNFRGTVMRRTGMYMQRMLRDYIESMKASRTSLDRPAGEGGETVGNLVTEEGTFPQEFVSDKPPELDAPMDLSERMAIAREKEIQPKSSKELYEEEIGDTDEYYDALAKKYGVSKEHLAQLPEKLKAKERRTRTEKWEPEYTKELPADSVMRHALDSLESKKRELEALKRGISLDEFEKQFIKRDEPVMAKRTVEIPATVEEPLNLTEGERGVQAQKYARTGMRPPTTKQLPAKVVGAQTLKTRTTADPMQAHYEYALRPAKGEKYQTEAQRRQRLINMIEDDIMALEGNEHTAGIIDYLKLKKGEFIKPEDLAPKLSTEDKTVEYNPVTEATIPLKETPAQKRQRLGGKTYGQTPELTGPAKQPITAKPKEYVMYDDNTNTTKRVQSQEEVAALKKEGYRLLRSNTGEEVGSRFATAEENIGARRSFFKMTEAAADRLVDVDPRLGKAFRRWDVQKDIYEGWGNEAIHDLSKFDTEDINKVAAIHRDAFRNSKPLPSLSGKEKEISKILTNFYHDDIGMERNRLGMKIGGKAGSLTPSYVPDMLSPTAIDLLVNKATTPAGIKAANDWANHIVKESAGKITLPEATEYVDQYTRAMGSGKDNNYLSVEFGALRKAEGYGVPDSLRETDAVAALSRYARRAATDMAMFKEMQANKEIGAMLGLKDDTGKTITSPGIKPLDKDRRVQDAMKWVTGNYASGKAALNSPRLTAASRLVNNSILGPITALKDSASVPVNMLPYINRFEDLGAAWSGVMEMRKNAREAIRYGATKPSMDKIAFADVMTSPDRVTEALRKMASFARLIQGRETIENLNRDLTFSIGKELARSNVQGAKNGNAKSKLFLKNFGELVEGDITKMSGKDLEEALNIMGKNFTDRNQGSYGVRGLPTGIVDSQFAPFLALQKWSVEKNNVIYKDVIAPFISGENRLPMITYTLGSVLTGAAIQQLNRALSGRKSQDPEVKEVLAKGDAKDYVAQLATLMQLGSYAGIVGDGMKAAADAVVYGKTPRNLASFPTAALAFDLQEKIADVAEALKNDEDPMKVFQLFAVDVLSQNIQGARMIANRTINEGKIERSDKFRDLRVFQQLDGAPNADFPKVNPYLNLDAKQFKRTGDLGEASRMVPALLKRAMEQSEGSPEKLRKKLDSLKGISYNTMPNMNSQPQAFQEYYQYLVDTQGKQEADTRMADFLQQSATNKMKSSMFPSL